MRWDVTSEDAKRRPPLKPHHMANKPPRKTTVEAKLQLRGGAGVNSNGQRSSTRVANRESFCDYAGDGC